MESEKKTRINGYPVRPLSDLLTVHPKVESKRFIKKVAESKLKTMVEKHQMFF